MQGVCRGAGARVLELSLPKEEDKEPQPAQQRQIKQEEAAAEDADQMSPLQTLEQLQQEAKHIVRQLYTECSVQKTAQLDTQLQLNAAAQEEAKRLHAAQQAQQAQQQQMKKEEPAAEDQQTLPLQTLSKLQQEAERLEQHLQGKHPTEEMISMHFRMQINAAEQQEARRLLTTPQAQQQDTAADAVDLKVLDQTLKQLQQETSQLKQLLNAEHSSPIQRQLMCQLGKVNAAIICGEHLQYRHRTSNRGTTECTAGEKLRLDDIHQSIQSLELQSQQIKSQLHNEPNVKMSVKFITWAQQIGIKQHLAAQRLQREEATIAARKQARVVDEHQCAQRKQRDQRMFAYCLNLARASDQSVQSMQENRAPNALLQPRTESACKAVSDAFSDFTLLTALYVLRFLHSCTCACVYKKAVASGRTLLVLLNLPGTPHAGDCKANLRQCAFSNTPEGWQFLNMVACKGHKLRTAFSE